MFYHPNLFQETHFIWKILLRGQLFPIYIIKKCISRIFTETKDQVYPLVINPCLPHFSGVTRLPHMGPKDPGEKNCYKKWKITYIDSKFFLKLLEYLL